MYPVASILSPQGPDFERACLQFAEGVPAEGSITLPNGELFEWTREETIYWACVDLATKFGENAKDNWQGRYQWTLDNLARVRVIAADPWESMDLWKKTDEPFQLVAACAELVALIDGEIDECRVMTAWDGTASGLQHLAAGTRDGELAPLVNICRNDRPGDIYSKVSKRADAVVIERMAKDSTFIDPRLKTSRLPYEWKFDRTAAKRGGSMTIPYGARPISCRQKLEEMVAEKDAPWIRPVLAKGQKEKDIDPRMKDYASVLWQSVVDSITRPVRAMGVMRSIYSAFEKTQRQLPERGPPDFTHIRQPQRLPLQLPQAHRRDNRRRLRLPGDAAEPLIRCTASDQPGEPQPRRLRLEALRGSIAPGIVHALDSALLHVLLGKFWPSCDQGPASTIHDALLCPAPLAPLMLEAGRLSFHEIHQDSFLEDFSQQTLGYVHPALTNEDEDKNIICRSSGAWHPDDVRESGFLFS